MSAADMRIVTALLSLLVALALPAHATQTDPVLDVTAARALASPNGTHVEIDARFPDADLVQGAIVLHVVVRDLGGDGTAYVRFPLGSPPVSGTSAALADGFDAGDVAELLASGAPLAGARLLHVAPGRIELWLPPAFDAASLEVQLFVLYEGDPILSNPAEATP